MDRDIPVFSGLKLNEDETNNTEVILSRKCFTGSQVDASADIHSFTKSIDGKCQEWKPIITDVRSLVGRQLARLKNTEVGKTSVHTEQEMNDGELAPRLLDVPFVGYDAKSMEEFADSKSFQATEVDRRSAELGKPVLKAAVAHEKSKYYSNKPDCLQSELDAAEKERAYPCQYCEKRFSDERRFKAHGKTHAAVKTVSCLYGDKRFARNSYLKEHIMCKYTGDKAFACTLCDKTFISKYKLTIHSRVHTGERPHECSCCAKRFSQNAHLKEHVKRHAGEKTFSCSWCDKHFITNSKLTLHVRVHTGEKPYECSCCGRQFTQKGHLKEHVRSHTGERPFSCSQCDKQFFSKNGFTNHKLTHRAERPFACLCCGKRFIRKCHLQQHVKIHTGEKPFSCTLCDKHFVSRRGLHSHMIAHSGERRYTCPDCVKRFYWKCDLTKHMRRHTNEKPFTCTRCDKQFVTKSDLTSHEWIHSGEIRQECQYCNKQFVHRRNLLAHVRRHASDTQHKFSQCNKQLDTRSDLINEAASHSEAILDECQHCDERFDELDQLDSNITTRVNENNPVHADMRPPCESKATQMDNSRPPSAVLGHNILKSENTAAEAPNSSTWMQCVGKKPSVAGYCCTTKSVGDEEVFSGSFDPLLCKYSGTKAICKKTEPLSDCIQYNEGPSGLANFVSTPYVCENCPNRYSVSNQLQRHSLTHDDVKTSYECEECRTRFTDYGQLLWHMLAHAQESHAHQQQQVLEEEAMNLSQTVKTLVKAEPFND